THQTIRAGKSCPEIDLLGQFVTRGVRSNRTNFKIQAGKKMAKGTKIGILTGGGDVPGLNSAIKAVVHRGKEMGRPIVGIRRGWKGLTHFRATGEPDEAFAEELTLANTETIERTGGTVLHTSRTNPKKMSESKVPANFPRERLKQLPFDGKVYDFTSIVIEN